MKAPLILEWIGGEEERRLLSSPLWGGPPIRKPWVAEVVGRYNSGKLKRDFLSGAYDYSDSNSSGSRGIKLCFILESNKLYEVHSYASWRSAVNYFCAVTEAGDIMRLNNNEVDEWLNAI
jgi:hypothetical protein